MDWKENFEITVATPPTNMLPILYTDMGIADYLFNKPCIVGQHPFTQGFTNGEYKMLIG